MSDQLNDIHDLLKKKGVNPKDMPFSLDEIKMNVDKGRYKRLDRFQEDLFTLFMRAKQVYDVNSTVSIFLLDS